MRIRQPTPSGIVIGAALVIVLTAGSAAAAKLITSADIKNETIQSADIKNGTVSTKDVKNNNLASGDIKDGTIGSQDLSQAAKDSLATTYSGPEWSVVDRNVIGGGDSDLRAGPGTPPLGVGSLGMRTGSDQDAAAFGNQTDFFQMPVSGLTQVGYWVYTTAENNSKSATGNMPGIKIEINPNLEAPLNGVVFTTMVYQPSNGNAGQWTPFDAVADTAPHWGLTGAALNGSVCSINGPRCTFQELMTFLNDGGAAATIFTVQVGKGRDFAFSGAVDSVVINDQTYDFEPLGTVTTTTTPATLRRR